MPTKDEIKTFSIMIEKLASELNCNRMDAILEHCKDTGLEIEVAATLINANLKAKIENDAMDHNMLKEKGSRLPI